MTVLAAVCGCTADDAPRLSRAEKDIIDADGIMRVLTVVDREDSLVLRSECTDFPLKTLRSLSVASGSMRHFFFRYSVVPRRYTWMQVRLRCSSCSY